MNTLIVSNSNHQVSGAFDNNRILERKPIAFPGEGGKITSFSSLFYWAYAWSDKGGLIGEHPHKGFEILTYIIQGEIEHYDSQLRGWKRLKAGDAQIIRAGNGISHSEKLLAGSKIFQIWFDPDLSVTLSSPASYDDYSGSLFPEEEHYGIKIKHIKGGGSPLKMTTPGIVIREFEIPQMQYIIPRKKNSFMAAFLIQGILTINERKLFPGDFILFKEVDKEVLINVTLDSRLFVIETPENTGYPLYKDFR